MQYEPAISQAEQAAQAAPSHNVTKNTSAQHTVGSQDTSHAGGTGDARDTTKTVDQAVAERLSGDPEYQRLSQQLAEAESLKDDWYLVEANALLANDSILTKADIAAVANDPLRPQGVRDAAQRLLNNGTFLTGVNGNDTTASAQDVENFVKGLRDAIKAMKENVKAEVKAERGIESPATGSGSTPQTDNAQARVAQEQGAASGASETAEQIVAEAKNGAAPKPPPSTRGGLEGAEENATNMMGWMEGEFDRLTALMSKTDDPKVQKQLEMQLNQLSRRMQSMTAMLNQLTTMMSNISKMYADIAMNSIRNMR